MVKVTNITQVMLIKAEKYESVVVVPGVLFTWHFARKKNCRVERTPDSTKFLHCK